MTVQVADGDDGVIQVFEHIGIVSRLLLFEIVKHRDYFVSLFPVLKRGFADDPVHGRYSRMRGYGGQPGYD